MCGWSCVCKCCEQTRNRRIRSESLRFGVVYTLLRMRLSRYAHFLLLSVHRESDLASFRVHNKIACGKAASGYTAAISQLAFGSAPGLGAGDACGRCFSLTANADPYSPAFTGPFKTIIVKVTDMCPDQGNQEWCGQTTSSPTNQHGASVQ